MADHVSIAYLNMNDFLATGRVTSCYFVAMDKENNNRRYRRRRQEPAKQATTPQFRKQRVAIVVLGDIGRSPRMQYHALSLAKAGFDVDLVGYPGSRPLEKILSNSNIRLCHIKTLPGLSSEAPRAAFYLYAPIKILWLVLALFWVLLFSIDTLNYILVQNPPAIPTLMVVKVCAWMRGAKLIIDWHNYGYTILGLKLGSEHLLVSMARKFEMSFGRSAYAHLCVTSAMASNLRNTWKVRGRLVVLHDKAPQHFRRLEVSEIHSFWNRMLRDQQFDILREKFAVADNELSLLTCQNNGKIEMRSERPVVLVSSTSWTADEDFSVLLDALKQYDGSSSSSSSVALHLPELVVLITGKGPLKGFYEAEISRLQLSRVCILTTWLAAEDYPRLLGSADLGISLHTSSSGLDLPMKVVDMLGCGTPVCAYNFACLDELVEVGNNGLVFRTASELSQQIQVSKTGIGAWYFT